MLWIRDHSGMKDNIIYCGRESAESDRGSSFDPGENILNMKYSDLPTSEYSCFTCVFQDERAFEEFKNDLRDFQKLKNDCCSHDVVNDCRDMDGLIDLNELQFICRPNYVCKSRRGHTRKSLQELKQKPVKGTLGRGFVRLSLPTCESSSLSSAVEDKLPPRNSPEDSEKCGKSDSFVQRVGSNGRSAIVDIESNSEVTPDPNNVLNGLLDDENFQEFERVFETVRDLDVNRRLSSKRRSRSYHKFDDESVDSASENVHLSIGDIFSDFFDNDESFLEFEKEFNNFRSRRRSNFLESDLGSGQDILDDLKVYCDINMSSILQSPSSCSSQEDSVLVGGDELRRKSLFGSSAEDLRQLFRFRLYVNQPGCVCQQRHSFAEVPGLEQCTEGQSLDHSSNYRSPNRRLDMTIRPCSDVDSKNSSNISQHNGGLMNLKERQTRPRYFICSSPLILQTSSKNDDSCTVTSPHLDVTNSKSHDSCTVTSPHLDVTNSKSHDSCAVISSYLDVTNNKSDDYPSAISSLSHCDKKDDNYLKDRSAFLDFSFDEGYSETENPSVVYTNHDYIKENPSFMYIDHDYVENPSFITNIKKDDNSLTKNSNFLHTCNNNNSLWSNSCLRHKNISDSDDVMDKSRVPYLSDNHKSRGPYLSDNHKSRVPYLSDNHKSRGPYLSDNQGDDKWADTLDGWDSPIADHCSSPSCFCRSDLHIEEPCDVTPVGSGPLESQPSINQSCHQEQRVYSNSLNNFTISKKYLENDKLLGDYFAQQVSYQHVDRRQSSSLDLEHSDIFTDNRKNRPSSVASSEHSDVDSECYHTATSSQSGSYSTAKSHLSVFVGSSGSEFSDEYVNFDICEKSIPNAGLPEDVFFDVTELLIGQSLVKGQRHSYDEGGSQVKYKLDRPRSVSACQYTCHQHCISAVTLGCKTTSGDGSDCSAASSPVTPGPQPPLFRSIHSRPGSAIIVPAIGNTTKDTARESFQNFQQISPAISKKVDVPQELAYGYVDTPKMSSLSTHHYDLATSHIPQYSTASCSTQECSKTSSSQCPSTYYSDSHISSQHPNSSKLPQPHATSNNPASGGIIKNIQVDVSTIAISYTRSEDLPAAELTKNNVTRFTDVDRTDEETNPEATTEKDETDSGYRSGTIPDDNLPRVPSQTTLDQQELIRKVAKYKHFVPAVNLEVTGKDSFQGFLKVTMNLIRPITMELGARPPSIYELLTREHIIEENTQHVAFYMPRDTHKSLHVTSDTTTKEVIASLLKKFHILDHPRKFAMYDQEFSDRNKLVRLRRLTDKDCPLRAMINWDPERIRNYRMVLQENETGEIVWDAFSLPELNNFLRVLDREEKETVIDLKHKYAYMKQYMERRLVELRSECSKTKYTT